MWEKTRVDGTRKLKHNVVRTIFPIIYQGKEENSHTRTVRSFTLNMM